MSTTFAIVSPNEKGELERIDIAHRSGIGNGLVGIKWFDISIKELKIIQSMLKNNNLKLSDLQVTAMDNTAQGVNTIGDLFILDDFGTLGKKNNIEEIDKFESDLKSESNTDKIKALEQRIEAVETLFNNINEINYINNKTKGDKNG
jgi:hypothetical protein